MSCNLATEQAAACTSGIGRLTDPIQLFQVIAENYAELSLQGNPANTNSVDAIRARACVSGIGKITDENALYRIIAQNLCALAAGTPVVTVSIDSVSPNPIDHFGGQTLTLTGSGFSTLSSPTITAPETVLITFGAVIVVSDTTITVPTNAATGEYRGNMTLTLKRSGVTVATKVISTD